MKKIIVFCALALLFIVAYYYLASGRWKAPPLESNSPDSHVFVMGLPFQSESIKNHPLNGTLRLFVQRRKEGRKFFFEEKIQTRIFDSNDLIIEWDKNEFSIKKQNEELIRFQVTEKESVCIKGCAFLAPDPYLSQDDKK